MKEEQFSMRIEDLLTSNLEDVYKTGLLQHLRDRAFSKELDNLDSLEKLEKMVFESSFELKKRSVAELLEISNRFRLLSSPEDEIRVYESCQNKQFRATPRAREFYILALNKVGREDDALVECEEILESDPRNGFVRGMIGNIYSVKMIALKKQVKASRLEKIDSKDIDFSKKSMGKRALEMYRDGFQYSPSPFLGLGWLMRLMDLRLDLIQEHSGISTSCTNEKFSKDQKEKLDELECEIRKCNQQFIYLKKLIEIMLTMDGGVESLDYWTHSGMLIIACFNIKSQAEISEIFENMHHTVDANFKLKTTHADLQHIIGQYEDELALQSALSDNLKNEGVILSIRSLLLKWEMDGLDNGLSKIQQVGNGNSAISSNNNHEEAIACFKKNTINFRPILNSLVPQYVIGAIGRVGARVPDLAITRNVRADLKSIIEENILAKTFGDTEEVESVINAIQEYIGEKLELSLLQDLQAASHKDFDSLSNAMISLSGIDEEMRLGARTVTDLTATLLLQIGDCRETMFLNGALFSCYQQVLVEKRIEDIVDSLHQQNYSDADKLLAEIKKVMRYQLRGGHVSVYADSIAMNGKYHVQPSLLDKAFPAQRVYDLNSLIEGKVLSKYELENASLKVTYKNAEIKFLHPRDPQTGKPLPLRNTASACGGGVPLIPDAGDNFENIENIQLWNLVEEHSLTFLYDEEKGEIHYSDGFYNRKLFDSPYAFDSGKLPLDDFLLNDHFFSAGTRTLNNADNQKVESNVYISFLPHSKTDYHPSLGEGDIPFKFRFMGRTFDGSLHEERKKIENGELNIKAIKDKISLWYKSKN